MNPQLKKYLWILVRVMISVACVAYVMTKVDFYDRVDLVDRAGDGAIVSGWITAVTDQRVALRLKGGEIRSYAVQSEPEQFRQAAPSGASGWVARDPETGKPLARAGFLSALKVVFTGGHWAWFLAAIVSYALATVFCAWRWRRLLLVQDIPLTFLEAWRLTYIGYFFNTFMIGVTGGDVIKAYYVAKRAEKRAEAVTTVFLDRFIGMIAMAGLAGLAFVASGTDAQLREAKLFVLLFMAGVALGAVIFFSRRIRGFLRLKQLASKLPFSQMITRLDSAVFVYRYHPKALLIAMVQSWGAHAVSIACVFFSALSLGLAPLPIFFIIYMPVIWIAAGFIPCIGGLGPVEILTQRYFTSTVLGVPDAFEKALAMALLARAAQFVAVLPGGILNAMHSEVTVKEAAAEVRAMEQANG